MKWISKPPLGTPLNWAHPLNKGLVGFWLLNEGMGDKAYDISGNRNHGTLTNMAFPPTAASGWNPSRKGRGLTLDGLDDYVSFSTFTIPTNVTFEAWINGTAFASAGGNVIIGVSDATTVNSNFMFVYPVDASTRYIALKEYTGAGKYRTWRGSTNLNSNIWYHVVVTQSGVGATPIFYVNGVVETTNLADSGGTMSGRNSQPLVIGKMGSADLWYFNGSIDEVRIWNRALFASEVQELYINPYGVFL